METTYCTRTEIQTARGLAAAHLPGTGLSTGPSAGIPGTGVSVLSGKRTGALPAFMADTDSPVSVPVRTQESRPPREGPGSA